MATFPTKNSSHCRVNQWLDGDRKKEARPRALQQALPVHLHFRRRPSWHRRRIRVGAAGGNRRDHGSLSWTLLPKPARDRHAALVLDGAWWHGKAALNVPDNVTLLTLPPYSPELNPVERVWLYLRERYLSFRLHQNEEDIVDALCTAWNALRAEPGRLKTLTSYPWIIRACEQVGT